MTDMHAQTRLFRRNSTYYFRARIPRDLQPYLGKAEEKFSLKTKDYAEAKRLAREASVDFDNRCQRLREEIRRRQAAKDPLIIDNELIREICALWRHQTLANDEYHRREGFFRSEFEERKAEALETQDALREALSQSRLEAIEPALGIFLHVLGIELRGSESKYRELLYRFLQTTAEVHNLQLARSEGEVVWTPEPIQTTRLVQPQTGTLTLEELFEDWQRFDPSRPARTINDVRRVIKDFQELIGKKSVEEISRQDIIRYRDDLISRGLRPKTIGKKITFICALFNVSINNGKLTINPAQRIPIPKSDCRHRLPFDIDDLKYIFRSPLYTRGKRLGRRIGEASVWIPLLALFQGCRVEELAQLLVVDIQKIDGIWCIVIDDMPGENGEQKRLKNTSSRRRLPLHPQVIETGFLRYVEQLRIKGEVRLFPDLRADRFGKFSAAFSKAFMKYLRKELGITDPRKVFHSLRHTFRDACREAGLDEEIADALMGHSNTQRMGRRYGSSFSIRRLNEAICRIEYPGLEIPILVSENE